MLTNGLCEVDSKSGNDLVTATLDGNLHLVHSQLGDGFNPNAPNDSGARALEMASELGYDELVGLLLQHGADPNLSARKTALMRAATRGHEGILKQLIRRGADLDQRDSKGQTALIWATAYGRYQSVKLLLNAGADPTLVDDKGYSAIQFAKELGHDRIDALL